MRFRHSSFYMGRYCASQNKTLEEKYYVSEQEYAAHGGAFPLIIKDVGVVGTITVSGLAQEVTTLYHLVLFPFLLTIYNIGRSCSGCSYCARIYWTINKKAICVCCIFTKVDERRNAWWWWGEMYMKGASWYLHYYRLKVFDLHLDEVLAGDHDKSNDSMFIYNGKGREKRA